MLGVRALCGVGDIIVEGVRRSRDSAMREKVGRSGMRVLCGVVFSH